MDFWRHLAAGDSNACYEVLGRILQIDLAAYMMHVELGSIVNQLSDEWNIGVLEADSFAKQIREEWSDGL